MQCVLNFAENIEEDGGTIIVPKFHHHIRQWCKDHSHLRKKLPWLTFSKLNDRRDESSTDSHISSNFQSDRKSNSNMSDTLTRKVEQIENLAMKKEEFQTDENISDSNLELRNQSVCVPVPVPVPVSVPVPVPVSVPVPVPVPVPVLVPVPVSVPVPVPVSVPVPVPVSVPVPVPVSVPVPVPVPVPVSVPVPVPVLAPIPVPVPVLSIKKDSCGKISRGDIAQSSCIESEDIVIFLDEVRNFR